MFRNKKRFAIGLLAMTLFALTGLSTLQATVEPVAASPTLDPVQEPTFGFCQNIFIQCGGVDVCPSGCNCGSFGVCLSN